MWRKKQTVVESIQGYESLWISCAIVRFVLNQNQKNVKKIKKKKKV
ncbi:hypothetical protein SAMN05216311_1092 [Chitinophaga sp. CF418]|nr:hypothetical protein SAMN05216311_1092 [Chitinophaga sp. CF418]